MIEYLKTLGFVEYKMEEIKECYELEFPKLNKALSYYKFENNSEKISLYYLESGDIIEYSVDLSIIEKLVNHMKWQESEINKILKTEFTF